jgi:cytidylate kinase
MAGGTMCHLAINGEIGSGKTTVARMLAGSCGREVVSAGDILRQLAEVRGITALEANHLAEQDEDVDARIDAILIDLSRSRANLIYDSRIAWHLLPAALKVHLTVDPDVAAERLFSSRKSAVEAYLSIEDAKQSAERRYQSERRRFRGRYGVDVSLETNYDLVLDTSEAPVESIVAKIRHIWTRRLLMSSRVNLLEERIGDRR